MKINLQTALQINNPNEMRLFHAMLNYFDNNYPSVTWLRKTHQYYVRFDCIDTRTNTRYQNKRCEISDLFIITFSPGMQKVKATFLQAKFSKKDFRLPFSFYGDAFQYFLLSQRPNITDNHNPSFPQDILSNAQRDSIGSFGVFYHKSNMEFSFSVASEIQIISPRMVKGAKLQYKYKRAYRKRNPLDTDTRTVFGANAFEKALLGFEIGSPFNPHLIANILSIYYRTDPNVRNLFDSFGIGFQNQNDAQQVEHTHILIINVDEIQ